MAAGSASTTADAECFDIVVPLEDIAADFIVEPKRYNRCLHPAEPWRRETPFSMKLLEVAETGELVEQEYRMRYIGNKEAREKYAQQMQDRFDVLGVAGMLAEAQKLRDLVRVALLGRGWVGCWAARGQI